MSMSEEEQMAMMLKEMGMNSLDQLDEASGVSTETVEETPTAEPVVETPTTEEYITVGEKTTESINHKNLSITNLVELLGLPTAKQLITMESKLDLIFNKLEVLQAKTDRLNTQLEVYGAGPTGEKLEYQVSEIRAIMKKFFPMAFANNLKQETKIHLDVPSSGYKSQTVNNSKEEIVEEEKIAEEEEVEEPLTDEDFQSQESKKLREEMAEKMSRSK